MGSLPFDRGKTTVANKVISCPGGMASGRLETAATSHIQGFDELGLESAICRRRYINVSAQFLAFSFCNSARIATRDSAMIRCAWAGAKSLRDALFSIST